jgi:hypothetical protein
VVEGDFVPMLVPENAQFVLDMALSRVAAAGVNYQDVYGHVIDFYTPADPRRYYGVVVDTLRIQGTGTGDKDLTPTLSLIAQREEENDSLSKSDIDYSSLSPTTFMFSHASIELDDVRITDVEDFTLTVENNVMDSPFAWNASVQAAVRAHAISQMRAISVELTKLANEDTFNEAIRDGGYVTFQADFYHPDGHLLSILLPRCHVEQAEEDGTPSQQAKTSPTLEAVALPTGAEHAGEDIVYGVDLAAGGTTTLAAPTVTSTSA